MMKVSSRTIVRSLAVLVALGALAATASVGYSQAATEKLTTAKEVLARYVEVTGGVEKYKEIKGLAQEAAMSLALAGVEGTMEMKYSGPESLLVKVDLGAAGTESSGISGSTGWSDSVVTGTRLITGKELEQLKSQTDMRQYYEPDAVYKEMELLEEEAEVKEQPCYTLKLTRQSGSVEYEYYSIESGLKLKTKMTAETAMGALPIEMFYDKYEEYGGVQHPTLMVQKLPNGLEMEIKTTKFEVNPKFPEGTFDLPEKVKKLVEKQSK